MPILFQSQEIFQCYADLCGIGKKFSHHLSCIISYRQRYLHKYSDCDVLCFSQRSSKQVAHRTLPFPCCKQAGSSPSVPVLQLRSQMTAAYSVDAVLHAFFKHVLHDSLPLPCAVHLSAALPWSLGSPLQLTRHSCRAPVLVWFLHEFFKHPWHASDPLPCVRHESVIILGLILMSPALKFSEAAETERPIKTPANVPMMVCVWMFIC